MSDKLKVKWSSLDGKTAGEAEVPTGTSDALLDLCEDNGLDLPHGCRSGSCGSCRVEVLAGDETLAERDFLEQDTLERHQDKPNIRLACRAQIKSAGTLTLKQAPLPKFED